MNPTDPDDIEAMLDGYLECALWAGQNWPEDSDDNPTPWDQNYGVDNIAACAIEDASKLCNTFATDNAADLTTWDPGQAGHDLFLTRNHHGAGFWDRGHGAAGDRLTTAAERYGDQDFYLNEHGALEWENNDIPLYVSQAARDAQASNYGGPSYWAYLDATALRMREHYLSRGDTASANRMLTRTLSEALVGNDGD